MSNFDITSIVANEESGAINVVEIFKQPLDAVLDSAIVTSLFDTVSTIGITLMLIYFLLDLEEVALRQTFNIEMFVKNLVKFVIAIIVITNVGPILKWANDLTTGVLADLAAAQGTFDLTPKIGSAKSVANSILKHSAQSETFSKSLLVDLTFIFTIIIHIVLWIVAIKRAIEIGVYYIVSPIVFADVFSDGLSGVVKRFKPFLASYLQLPYVLIIIALANSIIDKVTGFVVTSSAVLVAYIALKAVVNGVSRSKDELDRFLES